MDENNEFEDYEIVRNFSSCCGSIIDKKHKKIFQIPVIVLGRKQYSLGYGLSKAGEDYRPFIKINKLVDPSIYTNLDPGSPLTVKDKNVNGVHDGIEPMLYLQIDDVRVLKGIIKGSKKLIKQLRKNSKEKTKKC